ncbi:MAG: hypothetical protein GY913_10415 [Proteobacteria bacterium]|nr:hypothetical protein [Pseudomonadota bacterium]MCP4917326.1 hypothetical protein [Pseudomonadota bacterium]
MDPSTAAALTLTLFPTSDHREIGAGPYSFDQMAGPQLVDGIPSPPVEGLEIMQRRVFDTEDALFESSTTPTGQGGRLRMYRDATGQIVLDQLVIESLPLNLRVRPDMGDQLDVGLFAGSWDEVWKFGDTGRMQWRVYSPMNVTVLGLSKSDMGTDKLRYYASVGSGVGGEILARVAGPVGIQVRAEGEANARRRRERENNVHHSTRQELRAEAELGLTLLTEKQAWVLGLWGEHIWQYEPFDSGGRDGVDRTYFATGARISGRFYKDRERSLDVPGIDQDMTDIDALLEVLRREAESEGIEPETIEPETIEPEVEEVPNEVVPSGPVEVHWSELDVVTQVAPTWPWNVDSATTCSLRFYVDPTGQPYDIRPEECPQELLPSTMESAWGWRFAPVLEGEDTVSAQFVYTLTIDDVEVAKAGASDGN